MAARWPFWRRWKSIGFCLWPPSTCIRNLKLKFLRKLHLCSGNHVVYRRTDGRTDGQGESIIPPSNFVGQGYDKIKIFPYHDVIIFSVTLMAAFRVMMRVLWACFRSLQALRLWAATSNPSIQSDTRVTRSSLWNIEVFLSYRSYASHLLDMV